MLRQPRCCVPGHQLSLAQTQRFDRSCALVAWADSPQPGQFGASHIVLQLVQHALRGSSFTSSRSEAGSGSTSWESSLDRRFR
jgi:hypothetical protein